MSTGLPRPCCATGSLHTGTPTGKVDKIHGLDAYIAAPPDGIKPKGVIVIIPDIFGWTLANTRILADEYAEQGSFTVYLPNFMHGPAFAPDMLMSIQTVQKSEGLYSLAARAFHLVRLLYHGIPFLIRNRASVVLPEILSFFAELRDDTCPDLPIGAAGFCWGGMPVIKLCHAATRTTRAGLDLVDVGFCAHPSFLGMPDDAERLVKPLSFAAAGNDGKAMVKQAETIKGVMEQKNREALDREGARGVRHEWVCYEGADHGFTIRADEKDEIAAEKGKRAEEQAVRWFTRWFDEYAEQDRHQAAP